MSEFYQDTLEEQVRVLLKELEGACAIQAKLMAERDTAERERDEARAKAAERARQLHDARIEMGRMRLFYEVERRVYAEERDEARAKLGQAEAELDKVEDQLVEARKDRDKAEDERDQALIALANARAGQGKAEAERDAAQAKLAEAEDQRDRWASMAWTVGATKQEAEEAWAKLAEAEAQRDAAVGRVAIERDKARDKSDEAKAALTALEAQRDEYKHRAQRAENRVLRVVATLRGCLHWLAEWDKEPGETSYAPKDER